MPPIYPSLHSAVTSHIVESHRIHHMQHIFELIMQPYIIPARPHSSPPKHESTPTIIEIPILVFAFSTQDIYLFIYIYFIPRVRIIPYVTCT
jgi:hypothetical protein